MTSEEFSGLIIYTEKFDCDCNSIVSLQKRTLRNGTTTACYFATIHTDASLLLGKIASKMSQTQGHTYDLDLCYILFFYLSGIGYDITTYLGHC